MERANRMICGYCSQEQVTVLLCMQAFLFGGGGLAIWGGVMVSLNFYATIFFLGVHYQQAMHSVWL